MASPTSTWFLKQDIRLQLWGIWSVLLGSCLVWSHMQISHRPLEGWAMPNFFFCLFFSIFPFFLFFFFLSLEKLHEYKSDCAGLCSPDADICMLCFQSFPLMFIWLAFIGQLLHWWSMFINELISYLKEAFIMSTHNFGFQYWLCLVSLTLQSQSMLFVIISFHSVLEVQ